MADEAHSQAYDNVIKRLFERHAETILPMLLEEHDLGLEENQECLPMGHKSTFEHEGVEELNVEALIPPRRNDRVYHLPYKGVMHVANVEIETASNNGYAMAIRLRIYHDLLVEKYGSPVISLILYPFKTTIAQSPLLETNGDGKVNAFHFRVLPLWKLQAQVYFEQRNLCMYPFLPSMQEVTKIMLFQALDRMVQWYEDRQDPNGLYDELVAFGILLHRAAILPSADIEEVAMKIYHYDPLVMEDPHYGALIRSEAQKVAQAMIEEAEAKAKQAEAEVEKTKAAETALLKNTLLQIVETRFPNLAASASKAALLDDREALQRLMVRVATISDERTVRLMLNLPDEQDSL